MPKPWRGSRSPPFVQADENPPTATSPLRAFHLRTYELVDPIAFPRELFTEALAEHGRLVELHAAEILAAPGELVASRVPVHAWPQSAREIVDVLLTIRGRSVRRRLDAHAREHPAVKVLALVDTSGRALFTCFKTFVTEDDPLLAQIATALMVTASACRCLVGWRLFRRRQRDIDPVRRKRRWRAWKVVNERSERESAAEAWSLGRSGSR